MGLPTDPPLNDTAREFIEGLKSKIFVQVFGLKSEINLKFEM